MSHGPACATTGTSTVGSDSTEHSWLWLQPRWDPYTPCAAQALTGTLVGRSGAGHRQQPGTCGWSHGDAIHRSNRFEGFCGAPSPAPKPPKGWATSLTNKQLVVSATITRPLVRKSTPGDERSSLQKP